MQSPFKNKIETDKYVLFDKNVGEKQDEKESEVDLEKRQKISEALRLAYNRIHFWREHKTNDVYVHAERYFQPKPSAQNSNTSY